MQHAGKVKLAASFLRRQELLCAEGIAAEHSVAGRSADPDGDGVWGRTAAWACGTNSRCFQQC